MIKINKPINKIPESFDKLNIEIIEFFKNLDTDIKNMLPKNILRQNRKITYIDALVHSFLYSQQSETKQSVTSSLNFNNEQNVSRIAYYKKIELINIDIYKQLLIKLQHLYKKLYSNKDAITICAVDGTYNNTSSNIKSGELQTSLNMGYFDSTIGLPIDLTFHGSENKNKEVFQFMQYLEKHDIQNAIYVLDRAYYSYKLINLLIGSKKGFVIRIKNNTKMNLIEINKSLQIHEILRLVQFTQPVDFIFEHDQKKI